MEGQPKKTYLFFDEREERITARIATFVLFLTQIGLAGIIFYRRYALHQSNDQITDLNLLLAVSLFGFIALRLFLSAGLPDLSLKTTLFIYAGFVLTLGIILTIWFGFPRFAEWHNTVVPVLIGPAILLALYHGFAYLGRKRLEKELLGDDQDRDDQDQQDS